MDKTDGVDGPSLTLSGEVSADNRRFPRPTGETSIGSLPNAVLWDMDD